MYGLVTAGAAVLGGCTSDTDEPPKPPNRPPTHEPESGFVTVPGARLYYETSGAGPTLLMIHAGSGEASSWGGVVPIMARHHRVIAYDRRGSSRSTIDGGPKDAPPAVQADDAHHLLRKLGGGPMNVLGSSAGGIIALDLAARYPDDVRTVVSHEPPVFELLPDPTPYRTLAADVYDTYLREGTEPAFMKFFNGLGGPPGEVETEPGVDPNPDPAANARAAANNEFFIAHEMRAFMGYRPDVAALTATSARVVLGLGVPREDDLVPVAHTAAERLGKDLVRFPGEHTGYATHPKAFAAKLRDVLNGQ